MSAASDLPDTLPAVLHLGCGRLKHPGSLGVDQTPDPAVDVVWDLERRPWPLPENAFSRIYAFNVLEHLEDVVATMEEIHRVAKPGAEVRILSPAPSGHHLWTDPTHRRAFLSRSFQYFTEEFASRHFAYSAARFEVREVTYDPQGPWEPEEGWIWRYRPRWWDRLLLRWANDHKDLYERRFLYWFPVRNVYFRLRVTKSVR